MSIAFKDISIVVQGPIYGEPWLVRSRRYTYRTLKRLRELMPGATIILSTWRDANVLDLDYDKLIVSDDPGGQPLRVENGQVLGWNNVNRQIISTREGLKACTTPFAMKIRTDILIENLNFLSEFGRYNARDPEMTFVRDRVLSSAYHSRTGHNRERYKPCLFHPNDWFYFGRTEDVLDMWDVPLQSDEDARWFETHAKDPTKTDYSGHVGRWVAECYLWTRFLLKHTTFEYDSYFDTSPQLCELSERSMAANLVMLDQNRVKFISQKYPRYHWLTGWENYRGRFTHRDWLMLYRRYADPATSVPWIDIEPLTLRHQVPD